jgi:predicted TPR repeat methyltransferase
MVDPDNELLRRAYHLTGPEEAEEVYDRWAATYDADTVEGMGYVAPTLAARRLVQLRPAVGPVLDAGCGTGLAGAALARERVRAVDGVDLSEGMLERARSLGVYRTLTKADLTQPLGIPDDTYDAAICVGTFTAGHVGPQAFDELARVVRAGGLVVATVLEAVWESGGYRAHLDGMAARALALLRESPQRPYHERENLFCRLCVLEVR